MIKNFRSIIYAGLCLLFALVAQSLSAQVFTPRLPIYIVNGQRMSEEQVRAIEPEDILSNTMLPADEETIAKLLEVKWWDLPDEEVEKLLPDLVQGNMDSLIAKAKAAWEK